MWRGYSCPRTPTRRPFKVPQQPNHDQFLYLTTRGRKTGKPREIEIWFTELDGRYYVIAEYPTSQWVQNLGANPEVEVRVSGRAFAARSRVLSPDSDDDLLRAVQERSQAKYGWGEGLVVELTPRTH